MPQSAPSEGSKGSSATCNREAVAVLVCVVVGSKIALGWFLHLFGQGCRAVPAAGSPSPSTVGRQRFYDDDVIGLQEKTSRKSLCNQLSTVRRDDVRKPTVGLYAILNKGVVGTILLRPSIQNVDHFAINPRRRSKKSDRA